MQINSRNLTNILILFISLAAWWFTANVINPELQYFLQQTAFLTDSLFFQGFARYHDFRVYSKPEFSDLFLLIGQFFHFKTFGSFLIILVAAIQGFIAMNLVQRIAGKVNWNFSIFALILFGSVWVQCDYHYPFYASSRLLLASAFVWIFTVLIQKIPSIRLYIGFMLAILLFYFAGGAALFVFTAAAILIQIRFLVKKTEWFVIPGLILFAAVLPYFGYKYFFLVDFSVVYSVTHSKSPMILHYAADYKLYTLYSLLPLYILISVLQYKFGKTPEQAINQPIDTKKELLTHLKKDKKISGKTDTKKSGKEEKEKRKNWNPKLGWLAIQFSVILAASVTCLNFAVDKEDRAKTMVSYYGAERDWVQSIKDYDPFVNFEYNKALANTGKLAENLLNYPQLAGSRGLFLDGAVTSDVPFICSDQYYDLGFINESAHWTFEAQTIFPNSPRLMKRLVQIHLITGQYKIAEKFLNRLSENMLYQDWVNEYRKFIQDTSLVAKDPEFAWKRKCQPLGNFTANTYEDKLYKLMEANPANRMAWEYLLCSSLLDTDLGTFEKLLRENKTFPKSPLPRSWDEAMVLFSYIKQTTPGPEDVRFSPEKQKQFVSFIKAMKPFGNDWKSARQSLKNDFGTTFWYYTKCLSPKVTKAQIKQQRPDDK